MKKPHLLPFLLVFLLTACQMHHGLRLDEEEIRASSLEELLKGEGLDEEKTKEQMGWSKGGLLLHAAWGGWLSVVHKLLLEGARVDSEDYRGYTPLHWAAREGHTEIARLLLDKGAAVDSKDEDGDTPLHWAADRGHTAVMRLLIDKGAAVDSKTDADNTPLYYAAHYGHTGVAALLLSHGADLTIKDNIGRTALQLAQKNNNTETAAFLKLARGKSQAWLEAYYKAFTWEKGKEEKKAHAFAKSYANTFSKVKKNNTEEWSAAYHRAFLGQKQEEKSKKKSHAYAKVYADAYVKAKTNDNFKDAEKYAGAGDMYASYYALYIAQGKSHEDADGAAYIAATE